MIYEYAWQSLPISEASRNTRLYRAAGPSRYVWPWLVDIAMGEFGCEIYIWAQHVDYIPEIVADLQEMLADCLTIGSPTERTNEYHSSQGLTDDQKIWLQLKLSS